MLELLVMILLGFVCIFIGVDRNSKEDSSSKRDEFYESHAKKSEISQEQQPKKKSLQVEDSKRMPDYMKPLYEIVAEEREKYNKKKIGDESNATRKENG